MGSLLLAANGVVATPAGSRFGSITLSSSEANLGGGWLVPGRAAAAATAATAADAVFFSFTAVVVVVTVFFSFIAVVVAVTAAVPRSKASARRTGRPATSRWGACEATTAVRACAQPKRFNVRVWRVQCSGVVCGVYIYSAHISHAHCMHTAQTWEASMVSAATIGRKA
eukprot:scaffold95753_cov70-Phaeocystis_antarctica.AAC.5